MNKPNTAKNRSSLYYLYFGLFLLVVYIIATLSPGAVQNFAPSHITALNEGWSLSTNGLSYDDQTLPIRLNVDKNEIVTASKQLPLDFKHPMTLRIRSSMEDMSVYLDKQLIYTNHLDSTVNHLDALAISAWILIDIPPDSHDKLLTLELSSTIESMTGRVNGIYYGAYSDLVASLIFEQPIAVLAAVLIIAVAFFSLIVALAINLEKNIRLIYLNIFALALGIWLVSEMDLMQFLTGNRYIVGGISYIMLPVAMANLMLFLKEAALPKYHKFFNLAAISGYSYTVISLAIQLLFGVNFITIWPIFILLLILCITSTMILLIIESFKGDKNARKYLIYLLVLFGSAIVESLMFLTSNFMNISSYSSIGIVVFIILLLLDTLFYVHQSIQKEGEAIYLREIAYKDGLIGCLNRSAFERDIDLHLNNPQKIPFRLTMYDLNNLKLINDTFGHEFGDEALIAFYDSLIKVYKDPSMCYRIGGDEFMVIDQKISEAKHNEVINTLKETMAINSQNKSYFLETAHGSSVYNFTENFGDFKHEVDVKMYQEKKRQKDRAI